MSLIAQGPQGKLYAFSFQAGAFQQVIGRIRRSGASIKTIQLAIGKPGYYAVLYVRNSESVALAPDVSRRQS
jgi:hypothetical protein